MILRVGICFGELLVEHGDDQIFRKELSAVNVDCTGSDDLSSSACQV